MSLPAHFVGSLPLPSASSTFSSLPSSLPQGSLKRIPDGEPGERGNFTGWQYRVFGDQNLGPALMPFYGKDWRDDWSHEEIEEVMSKVPQVLETGYGAAALESWKVFRQVKADLKLAENVKFQVGIPTPTNFLPFGVQPAFQRAVEPRFAAGLE